MRDPRSDRPAGSGAAGSGSGALGSGSAPDDAPAGDARGCPVYSGIILAEVAFEFAIGTDRSREPDALDRAIADAVNDATWSP